MSLVSPIFRILKKVKTSNTEYCVRNYWFSTCHKYKTKREIKVSYKLAQMKSSILILYNNQKRLIVSR